MIGLISDTHGLLRDEALAWLDGSELIIHAGDVGKPEILHALRRIAPVVAVKGNIDTADLPGTAIVEHSRVRIYVLHRIQDLSLDPAAAGFHIVINGHSHKPDCMERDGVLYINPGSAGPRRFRLPITVALLNVTQYPAEVRFIYL